METIYILERFSCIKNAADNKSIETIEMELEQETLKGKIHLEYINESKTHFLMNYHPIKIDKRRCS